MQTGRKYFLILLAGIFLCTFISSGSVLAREPFQPPKPPEYNSETKPKTDDPVPQDEIKRPEPPTAPIPPEDKQTEITKPPRPPERPDASESVSPPSIKGEERTPPENRMSPEATQPPQERPGQEDVPVISPAPEAVKPPFDPSSSRTVMEPGVKLTGSSGLPSGSVGEVLVRPDENTIIFQVDEDRLAEALAKAEEKRVVVAMGPPVGVFGIKTDIIRIPASSFLSLMKGDKDLFLETERLGVIIPRENMTRMIHDDPNAHLQVELQYLLNEDSEAYKGDKDYGIKPVGVPVEIKLSLQAGGKTLRDLDAFPAELELVLPLSSALTDKERQKTGVYRLYEDTGRWKYLGGRLDRSNGAVAISLNKLSSFGLFIYEKSFDDLDDHWARDEVEVMASRHLIMGMTENMFAPQAGMTRAQFAALLVRALGISPVSVSEHLFVDVAEQDWYADVVFAAAQAGLLGGYPDGSFRPGEPVSRQELAVLLSRVLRKDGRLTGSDDASVLISHFSDEDAVAPWARSGVADVLQTGLMTGRDLDRFAPLEKMTRAEAAVVLKRFLSYAEML